MTATMAAAAASWRRLRCCRLKRPASSALRHLPTRSAEASPRRPVLPPCPRRGGGGGCCRWTACPLRRTSLSRVPQTMLCSAVPRPRPSTSTQDPYPRVRLRPATFGRRGGRRAQRWRCRRATSRTAWRRFQRARTSFRSWLSRHRQVCICAACWASLMPEGHAMHS